MTYTVEMRVCEPESDRPYPLHRAMLVGTAGEGENSFEVVLCTAEGRSEVGALRYLDLAVERMHLEQSTAVAKARRGR